MKEHKVVFLLVIAMTWLSSRESNAQVTGNVTDTNQQPLPQVNIIIKETDQGTQTDNFGRFTINANPGDTLYFSHIGMQPKEVLVERNPSVINILLQAIDIELEEVAVEAKRRRTHKTQEELLEEYPTNKNLIKTSKGIIDKDLSSSSFRLIDGNNLTTVGTDFLRSLKSFVPQMRVIRGDCDVCPSCDCVYLQKFGVRDLSNESPPTVIFDVDGVIHESPPIYLSSKDIDRIAIMERNAAISRYGTQGVGGVIVVNTKASTMMDELMVNREYDSALLDSLLREVSYLEPYHQKVPSYIKELQKAKTIKKALILYESQKDRYINDPYYFIDVYEFFLSQWGDNDKTNELFQMVKDSFQNDLTAMKAIAYLQQQYGNSEGALDLYIQILMLQSWDAQALRDVANAFVEAGDIKKAWMYYTQYITIVNQLPNDSFDAYGEDMLISTEMMDILDRHKEPFLDNDSIESILDDDMRTRLVFEWNNMEAEFGLQFITPEGFSDTWEHNPNGDVMNTPEFVKGYCSKQFFLGKENIGLWQVNIDYNGTLSEIPTYLKVSIYRNFGLTNQHLEVKVYKFSENHEKVQLFTLQN